MYRVSRSPTALTDASTCSAVVPRSQSYTLSYTTSNLRVESASRICAGSFRSAMMFSTRRPKSCFGLRCRIETSWPPFTSSSTSWRPMNRVPPITSTFICSQRKRCGSPPIGARRVFQKIQRLVVIFQTQVCDQVLAPHPAQRVLQFHQLDEDVVLGVNLGRVQRPLEVERHPFLDAPHPRPLRQIEEQHDVQHQRRGQDRVPAEEIDLDLHRVDQPPENVDIVPALFRVAAGRVILDSHLVVKLLVQVRVQIFLEDVLQ